MNIQEVRLKLVQQIVDRGVREANTIKEFIEPVAQYVVNGKIPEKKPCTTTQTLDNFNI